MAGFKRNNKRSKSRDSDRFDRDSDRSSGGFNRGSSFSDKVSRRPEFGQRSFSGPKRFGDREQKTMHKVVCDKCKKECEVPFRPTNNKPVYCSDCFRRNEQRAERFERSERHESPANSDVSEQLDEINRKLDAIMELLNLD